MIIFSIIGGGAAGVSALYQLVNNLTQKPLVEKIKIVLIEKSPEIGPGLAYSQNSHDVFLLNIPASKMSPIPDREHTDHFAKWLKDPQNTSKWKPLFPRLDIDKSEYLPRKLFGCYLKDLALVTKQKAANAGIEVEFITAEVTNIESNPQGLMEISLGNSSPILANSIVLCTGHLPPTQPAYSQFENLNQYYKTPWDIKVDSIPVDKDVLILGTRLTAIDAILARADYIEQQRKLNPTGTYGKMMAVSRSGLLPRVIGAVKPDYVRQYLTLEAIDSASDYRTKKITLSEIKKMLAKEIDRANHLVCGEPLKGEITDKEIDEIFKSLLSADYNPIELLQNEIFCAKNKVNRPWQMVLFSVYPFVPRIWEVLGDSDKTEFLAMYASLWFTYLAAFPIDNAQKIYSLLKEDRLQLYAGLQDVTYDPQNALFTVKVNDKNLQAPYIINATGQGHDITKASSPLLQNLLKSGHIRPHPFGGVEVDFTTLRAIGKNGEIPLFVVGDSTWGACMATADLSQLVNNQIPRVINSMLASFRRAEVVSSAKLIGQVAGSPVFASNKPTDSPHPPTNASDPGMKAF